MSRVNNTSRVDEAWNNYVKIFDDYHPKKTIGGNLEYENAQVSTQLREALFDWLVLFDQDQRERFGDEVTAPLADVSDEVEDVAA